MRRRITNTQLQMELLEILKNMLLYQKEMTNEQIKWLVEHKYIKMEEMDSNRCRGFPWPARADLQAGRKRESARAHARERERDEREREVVEEEEEARVAAASPEERSE
ncbi:hypothetical protein PHYPO_G00061560 [Pangasianodon hypophthalmus]|uniref:Uncharacterized protein n=1 Tax=Pangasianodon hypophthalmus TaxID=310915 RepID=A0A5N5M1H5_PANHP|nr:hypothetical protein PHYPO_G00061560 [Pangasianodon hypophthalmus]